MSLISLATVAPPRTRVQQRTDGAGENGAAGNNGGAEAQIEETDDRPTDSETQATHAGSLQRLVEFIPVESITLFWLAIPAAKALGRNLTDPGKAEWDWIA